MKLALLAPLLFLTGVGIAQPLTVYSELTEIDATGKVTRPAEPREILSPALARNGFTSFHVVVRTPKEAQWRMYVAQNPEDAVEVTMYREANGRFTKVALPVDGSGTQVFWMDLWTAKSAQVQRIKVEPQLYYERDWHIYPMEARIMRVTVPDADWQPGTATPTEVMRGLLCEAAVPASLPSAATPSLSSLRFRNAQQDAAIARSAPGAELRSVFGSCDETHSADDPEWYLQVRDFLFRQP